MITSPIEAVERTIAIMDGPPRSLAESHEMLENIEGERDKLKERVKALEMCFEETIDCLRRLLRNPFWQSDHRDRFIRIELKRLHDTKLFTFKVIDEEDQDGKEEKDQAETAAEEKE